MLNIKLKRAHVLLETALSAACISLIVDCPCGRRYFRSRIAEPTDRTTREFCICGHMLAESQGAFSLMFESERARRTRLGVKAAPARIF